MFRKALLFVGASVALAGCGSSMPSVTVHGQAGESAQFTLVRVINPVKVSSEPIPAGEHWVGIVLTLKDIGNAPFTDAPDDDVRLIAKSGQLYDVTTTAGGPCESPNPGMRIGSGDQQRVCEPFQVQDGTTPQALQVRLDDGTAPTSGRLRLTRGR